MIRSCGGGQAGGLFAKSFSSQLGKDTKKVKSLKEPVKDAQSELKLITSVRNAESNIKKGKPSTAEAKQIMAAVDAVEEVLDLEDMPEATIDRWEEAQPHPTRLRRLLRSRTTSQGARRSPFEFVWATGSVAR